jgi:hypothetical protein
MKTLHKHHANSEIDTLDHRFRLAKSELDIAPELSPPEFCRPKAEECLTLSDQITDPKGQMAVLKLANWWMSLAENYYSRRHPKKFRDSDREWSSKYRAL